MAIVRMAFRATPRSFSDWIYDFTIGHFTMIAIGLLGACSAGSASAEDLSSFSFIQRGGSFVAASSASLVSTAASPEFAGAGGSVGESLALAPVGSVVDLKTAIPGFWAIVAGGFPNLDLDGDLAQFFLDDDDDGDGLDDVVETGTGIFVSASNTGTSSVDFDSDNDGFSDGAEVLAGTDPNNAGSPPPNVPVSGTSARGLLIVLLILISSSFGLSRRRAI